MSVLLAALPVFTLNGRPAWLARDVGRVLGYGNDGRRLLTNIRDRWADELIPGSDFDVLTGAELERLKDVVTGSVTTSETTWGEGSPFPAKAPSATFLFESGLNLVCALSGLAVGDDLRRSLAERSLPGHAESGQPDAGPGSPARCKAVFTEILGERVPVILVRRRTVYLKQDVYWPASSVEDLIGGGLFLPIWQRIRDGRGGPQDLRKHTHYANLPSVYLWELKALLFGRRDTRPRWLSPTVLTPSGVEIACQGIGTERSSQVAQAIVAQTELLRPAL